MTIAIQHLRILTGLGNTVERATLLVDGERITGMGSDRTVRIPRGSTKIDGRGLTVLPGYIDCHVHLCLGAEADVVAASEQESSALSLVKATELARRTLEAGFTTVRDVGFRDHGIFTLKRAIEQGLAAGPRIVAAGLAICMPGGHARFIGREADGVEAVRAAVQAQLDAGAEVIKLIASGGVLTPGTSPDQAQMTVEELTAAVQVADAHGRHVAAHAHGSSGMKNAVRAGVHSIEHGTLLDEEAGSLMAERGVYMVPTLSALATTAACPAGCGIPDSARDKARSMVKQHQKSFRSARRRGVPIAFGTDAGTPFNHHGENAQEFERMVAFGMSPMEAIIAGTSAAARLLRLDQEIGSIAVRKQADLVFIEGNPLKKIELLRRKDKLVGVMQRGRFVAGPLSKT
ncbi:MAG: amidohydrolase family protein [Nitrospiraceae bacterium]|nr:amidohydrolase family protein [Nitrospiraceae bacterium]